MSFSVDLVNLVLYCVQQLGVVLGVGAQTVMLISFLRATRDGMIDAKEEQFGRVVVQVLKLGLVLMIVSGAMITAIHIAFGQLVIVETPAYLFKWALIGVIVGMTFFVARQPFAHFFWEGMLGAHWYALFVIHVLAPLVAWVDILVIYVLWTIGFILAWSAVVYSMRAKNKQAGAPAKLASPAPVVKQASPAPIVIKQTPPPPPPKPVAPPQPIAPPPPPKPTPPPQVKVAVPHKPEELPPHLEMPKKPALAVPQKPVEEPPKEPGLPTIRVMPKSKEDLETQIRASSVQSE